MSKICVICVKKIIDRKERWVRLTDFHKLKQVGEVFYHLECWRDRFRISNSLRKQEMYSQAMKGIKAISKVLNSTSKDSFEINPN